MYCGPVGVSTIKVTNALPASVYTWTTPDGHFAYPPSGTSVTVDTPGTYIVTQQLLDGCGSYASDTVVIVHDATCTPLTRNLLDFSGALYQKEARLRWVVSGDKYLKDFIVQRSADGKTFQNVHTVAASAGTERYSYIDTVGAKAVQLYYRLAMRNTSGTVAYSTVIRLQPDVRKQSAALYPNPATTSVQLSLFETSGDAAVITVLNAAGATMYTTKQALSNGDASVTITDVRSWAPGLYMVRITTAGKTEWLKLVIATKAPGRMK